MSDLPVTVAMAVDIAIAALVGEAVLLAVLARAGMRATRLAEAGPNLAAGGLILASFRLALAGVGLPWPLLPLAGALMAHLVDLWRRWPVH